MNMVRLLDGVAGRGGRAMADRYQGLVEYLSIRREDRVNVGFEQLELLLGGPLPPPAWTRAWWVNVVTSPQARAWLHAGWRVEDVDFGRKTVTFRRRGPSRTSWWGAGASAGRQG